MLAILLGVFTGLSFFVLLNVTLTVTEYLRKRRKVPQRISSADYKETLENYTDLMLRVTPLKDMTVDELYQVMCSCGNPYSEHLGKEEPCDFRGIKCHRHTKESAIRYYLKSAPIIREQELDIFHTV